MSELEIRIVPVGQTTSWRGAMTESVVDHVNGGVDEMVEDASREREVDETDESASLRGGRTVYRHLS
jgi:hypothetical protein